MLVAGYIAAVLIGVSLGLIGGGGSILTVPVLVYLFGILPTAATTYSLFIVGTTSLVGSMAYFRNKLVDVPTVLLFGLPSVATVLLTRKFLLPEIPENLLVTAGFVWTKDLLLLLLFSVLMVLASASMIRKSAARAHTSGDKVSYLRVLVQGAAVGMVTGLIGAGGGFLIIPALVQLLRLPIKTAVGTSLVIISLNALIGFFFSMDDQPIAWRLLLILSGIATVGILIGSKLSTKIDGRKLKPGFGWFVLVMGLYILLKETLLS